MNNLQESPLSVNRYVIYCRKSSESDERQIQSLTDQISILMNLIATRGLKIISEPLQESKSAKIPGRPVFNQMIKMIEKGIVNGVILLNPTRLSRNSVDTGRIIYLMDQGKLQEMVTPYQTFKNDPYDKFMLSLFCSQAKLENDNKSVYIKESLKLKAERGVFPGKARPGYLNNCNKQQGLRDISAHPIYFPLMRKLFDLALTGNFSIERLGKEAAALGIRSLRSGNPICKSTMHKLMRDPFYTGRFIYRGKLYKGNHPAMLTDGEFNLLQAIIEGRGKSKQQKRNFALTGLIKCGECQRSITAEEHSKHYKNGISQTFIYYRCTKKNKNIKCSQPYISSIKLEEQLLDIFSKLELEPEFKDWAYEVLGRESSIPHNSVEDSYKALHVAIDGVNKRLNNLLALKISPDNSDGDLLSDEEYIEKKRVLLQEKTKIAESLNNKISNYEGGKIDKENFNFASQVCRKFNEGDINDKKTIVKSIGTNLILLNKKLQFQPRFLFLKYKYNNEI